MAFTTAALTELLARDKDVEWRLYVKKPQETSWTEIVKFLDNWSLDLKEDIPATFKVAISNDNLDLSDEYRSSVNTRTYIRAHVQFRCTVGTETTVMFDGYIRRISPVDQSFTMECIDWSQIGNEASCRVQLVPDEIAVVAEFATPVEITLISATLGPSYAFPGGTANAFSAAGARRSWKRLAVTLFNDASRTYQYPQEDYYSIDYSSGAIRILDHNHAANDYFAANVYALKESAAGGTNVDVVRLIEQAFATARPMTARSAGAGGTFTVAGDVSDLYEAGDEFEVQQSASANHDGIYTVVSAVYGAPNTVITVNETVAAAAASGNLVHEDDYDSPRFTAAQLDLVDSGIDIDREYYFRGAISDLVGKIREDLGVHIKFRWDSANQKLKVRLATQKAGTRYAVTSVVAGAGGDFLIAGDQTVKFAATDVFYVHASTGNDEAYTVDSSSYAAGPAKTTITVLETIPDDTADGYLVHSEDLDHFLLHPQSIDQSRDDRDIYTMVIATGQKSLPVNEVTDPAGTLSDETTAGDWFRWDGLNVGGDSSFAAVSPLLYDADVNTAAGVHNLAATETNTPGSTYSGGTSKYSEWYNYVKHDFGSIKEIRRIRLVMPGSRNENAPHGAQTILSPAGDAVSFWPGVKLLGSVDGTNWFLITPLIDGRYEPQAVLDVQGDDILLPRCRYVFVLCAAYKHGYENQSDPGIGLGLLEIFTDIDYEVRCYVSGQDTSHSHTYTNGTTVLLYGRDMMERFDWKHKVLRLPLGNTVDEFLAGDVALRRLEESIRVFQTVEYQSICDPRIQLYDTVAVKDEMNGDVVSMLVFGLTFTRRGTRIYGVNFNAESLEDDL